ncbi:hypothetical protein [Paracoccus sp. (in: a-proteobacteria)]|uniref:hypothetical protein n=1 Tax=Paracoccus sp. TaxID=267 RepID=UPI002AFEFC5C|nr:hypothetical protein [Paracoccus sp. (in: a-proteobacteria)]
MFSKTLDLANHSKAIIHISRITGIGLQEFPCTGKFFGRDLPCPASKIPARPCSGFSFAHQSDLAGAAKIKAADE